MLTAELLYRDGGNFKFRCRYNVPTEYIEAFKSAKESDDAVMAVELGITQSQLVNMFDIEDYDPETDDTFIEVEELFEEPDAPESQPENAPENNDSTEHEEPETDDIETDVQINRILIGNLIQDYLKENKITVTTIAEAAGVSREQVGWLITGKRDPRLSTLLKVLAAMKFSLLIEKEE